MTSTGFFVESPSGKKFTSPPKKKTLVVQVDTWLWLSISGKKKFQFQYWPYLGFFLVRTASHLMAFNWSVSVVKWIHCVNQQPWWNTLEQPLVSKWNPVPLNKRALALLDWPCSLVYCLIQPGRWKSVPPQEGPRKKLKTVSKNPVAYYAV